MDLVMGGNGKGRAGDGWVCSLFSLSRTISLRSAWRVWVCGDRRDGGCLFVEISICGGDRRLWSRVRCGSRWLLGCGIDELVVGLWKSVTGLWESVFGLWDSVSGLCGFRFWWVWVCSDRRGFRVCSDRRGFAQIGVDFGFGLWDSVSGLCGFRFWWVWVCGYGFGSGGGGGVVGF